MTQKTQVDVVTAKAESDNDAPGPSKHFHPCGLLVSAASQDEWELAVHAGVDWIDLKDPRRGPLGRPDLGLARDFAQRMRSLPEYRWSIAGGELDAWRHDSDEAFCRILGDSGAIKWALAGCADKPNWKSKVADCARALPGSHQAILVHYADHRDCNAPTWGSVLEAACQSQLRYVLIDTAVKDGRGLFDHLSCDSLQSMITQARWMGLEVAIAGSLRLDQLAMGPRVQAAWVGVRGAVCDGADRTSHFHLDNLRQAVAIMRGCRATGKQRESMHVLR